METNLEIAIQPVYTSFNSKCGLINTTSSESNNLLDYPLAKHFILYIYQYCILNYIKWLYNYCTYVILKFIYNHWSKLFYIYNFIKKNKIMVTFILWPSLHILFELFHRFHTSINEKCDALEQNIFFVHYIYSLWLKIFECINIT